MGLHLRLPLILPNNTMSTNQVEGMEKRFDKEFPRGSDEFCGCMEGDMYGIWEEAKESLLSFIRKEIQEARESERKGVMKDVVKIILKVSREEYTESGKSFLTINTDRIMQKILKLQKSLTNTNTTNA